MVFSGATIFYIVSTGDHPPSGVDEWVSLIGLALFLALIIALQVVILIGCVRLIRGSYGKSTWAACVAALIPLGGQVCACISFLLAIWLLVLLSRKGLRAALAGTA
jgi:hypothetical protein